jgi:hypothetical protein
MYEWRASQENDIKILAWLHAELANKVGEPELAQSDSMTDQETP